MYPVAYILLLLNWTTENGREAFLLTKGFFFAALVLNGKLTALKRAAEEES